MKSGARPFNPRPFNLFGAFSDDDEDRSRQLQFAERRNGPLNSAFRQKHERGEEKRGGQRPLRQFLSITGQKRRDGVLRKTLLNITW